MANNLGIWELTSNSTCRIRPLIRKICPWKKIHRQKQIRHKSRIDRNEYNSQLQITPSLENNTLQLRLRHKIHTHNDIHEGSEAQTFINQRVKS